MTSSAPTSSPETATASDWSTLLRDGASRTERNPKLMTDVIADPDSDPTSVVLSS